MKTIICCKVCRYNSNALLFVTIVLQLVLFTFSIGYATPSEENNHTAEMAFPRDLPPGITPVIVKALQSSLPPEYQLKRHSNGEYSMSNPKHGMKILFSETGPQVVTGDSVWGIIMSGIGRAGKILPVPEAEMFNDKGKMVYNRGGISEWYLNSQWGVEQGFTIYSPPLGQNKDDLIVELKLSGNIKTELISDILRISDLSDKEIAQYTGLQVIDSQSKILTSRLSLRDTTLQIIIDDYPASYPITIDPWIQQSRLTASDAAVYDKFGKSVAISSNTIVVGAPGDCISGCETGSAYVFEKPSAGWTSMTQTAKLTASDGESLDKFGTGVAIDDETIVIGSPYGDGNTASSGVVYVFKKPAGGWVDMNETAKLYASDGRTSSTNFGEAVAVRADTVVVGDYSDDHNGNSNAGSAYVFVRPIGGWVDMAETAKFTASDSGLEAHFGRSVAIDGNTIVVGAKDKVYVFDKPLNGWSTSSESAALTATDMSANSNPGFNSIGDSVSISGDTIVAGSNGLHAVYVYEKPLMGWGYRTETAKLTPEPSSGHWASSFFGNTVSIDGNTIVAGDSNSQNPSGWTRGLVYLYNKHPLNGWSNTSESAIIPVSNNRYAGGYGTAIVVEGSTVVAGAFNDDFGGASSGSTYVSTVSAEVTASVLPCGSLAADTPSIQSVEYYSTIQLTFDADPGCFIQSISGCGIDFFNCDEAVIQHSASTEELTADCTAQVAFGVVQNMVIADAGEGGSLDPVTFSPQIQNPGDTTHFTFSADTGYHISVISSDTACGIDPHINTDNSLVSKTVTTAPFTESCGVYAQFDSNYYNVSAEASANGRLDLTTSSPNYIVHGGIATFTFNADPEFHVESITGCGVDFANTSDAISSKMVSTEPVTGDCTVSATFALNQNTVLAIVEINGTLDPTTPSPQTLNAGETTQFIFHADNHFFVKDISGCGIDFINTDKTLLSETVTISPFTQSCVISANFEYSAYTVSAVTGDNGGLGSATPSPVEISHGQSAQFTFNADPGYHVATINGCGIDYSNTDDTKISHTVITDPAFGACTVSGTFTINDNNVIGLPGQGGSLDVTTPSPQTVSLGDTAQFIFSADSTYFVSKITGCGIDYSNTDTNLVQSTVTTEPFTDSCIVNATFTSVYAMTNPGLVHDVNHLKFPALESSSPFDLTEFKSKVYFQATSGLYGSELWVYDGVHPPQMVVDIYPGVHGSLPSQFTVYDSKLYFQAGDGIHGGELWVYDGINPPEIVADVNPGFNSSNPANLTVFDSKLYFVCDDGTHGRELWVYDGVSAPTMVVDNHAGIFSSFPENFIEYNSKLYFQASDGGGGNLWQFDGVSNPSKVSGIRLSEKMAVFNGKLHFQANDYSGSDGYELWEYDGVTPPVMITDINPGLISSWPSEFTEFSAKLYFQADGGTHGKELWVYDGTNPPSMVADIFPGTQGVLPNSSEPYHLTVFNSRLIFSANDGVNGRELWEYDGTNPPFLLSNIFPGTRLNTTVPNSSNPSSIMVFNAKLYFSAENDTYGRELWQYDGGNPPVLAADIAVDTTYPSSPDHLVLFNSKLYFSASVNQNNDLWEYDGANTLIKVEDTYPGVAFSSPAFPVEFNSNLYFQADDGTNGKELWVFDGTNAPNMVADIFPGSQSSSPSFLVVYNSKLYFAADDGTNGRELWVYDGLNPPSMVADIIPGHGASSPGELEVFSSRLFFQAVDGTHGKEMWVYDDVHPPSMLTDMNLGTASSAPSNFIQFNAALYFQADDGANGSELWMYDGSTPPVMVMDINPDGGSFPGYLTIFNSKLYFQAYDGVNGTELWEYDGVDPPQISADIYPGPSSSSPNGLTVYRDKLYYQAADGVHGNELWRYDGFEPPTMLTDLYIGAKSSNPSNFTVFNSQLYFAADNGIVGSELWRFSHNVDSDNDSIVDGDDNCLYIGNVDQSDTDNDNIGNVCDSCPADPDNDWDRDGVCSATDSCPYDSNDDRDGDGICGNDDICPNDASNDIDGDGICGDIDNCPLVGNSSQADQDSDSIGDSCDLCSNDALNDVDGDSYCGDVDNCPLISNVSQLDLDTDNIGDVCDICFNDTGNDIDRDTICGNVDNCPIMSNKNQSDLDQDGIGDVCDICPYDDGNDIDSDGICGDIDNCSVISNADQSDHDNDGIGDVCDACPNDSNNDVDGDSYCGDVDNCPLLTNASQSDIDSDGLGDLCDICPDDPIKSANSGKCGCGISEIDTDGNGVPDCLEFPWPVFLQIIMNSAQP